jgi:hypothetical protein
MLCNNIWNVNGRRPDNFKQSTPSNEMLRRFRSFTRIFLWDVRLPKVTATIRFADSDVLLRKLQDNNIFNIFHDVNVLFSRDLHPRR